MKILLVEDEKDISSLYQEVLKENGFEVDAVFEGDLGFQKIMNGDFDLLILDLMLPNRDGISIIKEAHNEGYLESKKVMILSNIDRNDVEVLTKNYGVNRYIVKTSINPQEFVDIINSL